jgi:putative intracellular protease/amidase
MATILIPIPALDFDPTEVAVSWKTLTDLSHTVRFATPNGTPATADDIMITGEGLDLWGCVPGLRHIVVCGRFLRADKVGRDAYAAMTTTSLEFQHPSTWDDINLDTVDALLLPGGHRARGMHTYLESSRLQTVVVEAFQRKMPVAAVCHGVLLAARSIDPATGRSVLYGRKTTCLTWRQEHLAANISGIIRFWEPHYYRTYLEQPGQPSGYMSVQAEVTRALKDPANFIDVDPAEPDARIKNSGFQRDRLDNSRPAHIVEDGNYISARWPGDVHTFAKRFATLLSSQPTKV